MANTTTANTSVPDSNSTNREDLKQLATVIAATQAPICGLLPTRKITNKRPRVLMDRLHAPQTAGHIEGNDTATGVDKFDEVGEYEGQAQRMVREWKVTREQEAHSSAVVADKAGASEKALAELMRDKELTVCGDQAKTADVPGTTGGVTEGLGNIIDSANAEFGANYRTPAASIYSGLKASFDDAAFNAVLASMFGQGGEFLDLHLVAGTGLRSHIVEQFTRTAGSASQVDYNMNGTAVIPYTVEMYDSDFGQVKIINGNPACMPSVDRGYVIDPRYIEWGEIWGEGSEEYEDRGSGPVGACDLYGTLLSTGPNGLGKIEFSDET